MASWTASYAVPLTAKTAQPQPRSVGVRKPDGGGGGGGKQKSRQCCPSRVAQASIDRQKQGRGVCTNRASKTGPPVIHSYTDTNLSCSLA